MLSHYRFNSLMLVAQLSEIVTARSETRPREEDRREETRRKKENSSHRGEKDSRHSFSFAVGDGEQSSDSRASSNGSARFRARTLPIDRPAKESPQEAGDNNRSARDGAGKGISALCPFLLLSPLLRVIMRPLYSRSCWLLERERSSRCLSSSNLALEFFRAR